MLQPDVLRRGLAALMLVLPGWWLQDAAVLHGDALAALILAATASWLVFQRMTGEEAGQRDIRDQLLAVALVTASGVLATSVLLLGEGKQVMTLAALVLFTLSLVAALGNRRQLALVVIPILVLYLLVPMLPLFEAALSYPMRRLSAVLASLLLSLGSAEVRLSGTEIFVGDLQVSVTSACSGLTLLQHMAWIAWWTVLSRHRGLWRRAAHAAIALPAVLISNTLRVVVLAIWASVSGPEVLASAGHAYISWAAVAVAAFLFFAMGSIYKPSK